MNVEVTPLAQKQMKNLRNISILFSMLENLEKEGVGKGKLLDPKIPLYELKSKRPPLRVYYTVGENILLIYIDTKKSKQQQQKVIWLLRKRFQDVSKRNRFSLFFFLFRFFSKFS